ncbi:MAG: hypothetical protein IKQ84_05665 [Spirochaetaceae bacterium]|nr:hypothetical protein [Spirochaetaceae bacterium]
MFAQLSSFALAKLAGFARKAFGVESAQSQTRHCEERSDEAIQQSVIRQWIASPSARNDDFLVIAMTICLPSQ